MPTPNIIYIFADDMGYGDLGANNPQSRIPTPNLDRLAAEGMRCTDAHAGSSVCTPSRYTLLTGRYAWRSRLKRGIVWEWDGALIEPGTPTVASLLRDHGYRTACIGKWHLGWDWPTRDGRHPNECLRFGVRDEQEHRKRIAFNDRIDFTGRIAGGPVDRGFDSYFGVDVPNFPPYAWFENDRLTEQPTQWMSEVFPGQEGRSQPVWREGRAVAGWSMEAMIPQFTRRAVAMIEAHGQAPAATRPPLFLYFPLTSPHSPVVPNAPFLGMSGAGRYGDFVCEVDWVVGEVMAALARAGMAEDTLLIFASDNGPETRTGDDIGAYERVREHGHYSMGPYRGIKRDLWEGGHRVPLVTRWPKLVPAGARCDQLVCLGDLFATCCDLLGVAKPVGGAEDSISMLPLLRGALDQPTRQHLVHHSAAGRFAIRQGDWVFVDAVSGGENPVPAWFDQQRGYRPHDQPGELFNLADDEAERANLYAERPDVVAQLRALLRAQIGDALQQPAASGHENLTE